ncbi:bacterial Ig-like domain-containing protein [Paenibacillus sp. GXUN7292]|uniref:bacterial Ig-like domain-containing protein n=1 Tax=Paenibacillus sp. GXUN7292 TaxID=3422499 RepID=UPI003D7CC5DE
MQHSNAGPLKSTTLSEHEKWQSSRTGMNEHGLISSTPSGHAKPAVSSQYMHNNQPAYHIQSQSKEQYMKHFFNWSRLHKSRVRVIAAWLVVVVLFAAIVAPVQAMPIYEALENEAYATGALEKVAAGALDEDASIAGTVEGVSLEGSLEGGSQEVSAAEEPKEEASTTGAPEEDNSIEGAAVLAALEAENTAWVFRAFGSNTAASRNPEPELQEDGAIKLEASGGKIAQGDEGLSFYFQQLPAEEDFELAATAKVVHFNSQSSISTPNQKSFGFMLRSEVGEHGDSTKQSSNYVAVGALDTDMKAFYQNNGVLTKGMPYSQANKPGANEVYQISLKKSGELYIASVNGELSVFTAANMWGSSIYAGFFVARDASIQFSDYSLTIESNKAASLEINAENMKKTYLVGEALQTEGLQVTAVYEDGTRVSLTEDQYVVTGFNSGIEGTNSIQIHYGGQSASLALSIVPLSITELQVKYYPAKTDYYIGDFFDPDGLVITAAYNNDQTAELEKADYKLLINGTVADSSYKLLEAGSYTVLVEANDMPEITASFAIEVKSSLLTELVLKQEPVKKLYYLGDELDLTGIILTAQYNDGSEVRLMNGEYTVSFLDSSTAGMKEITITYKDKELKLQIEVRERKLQAIAITQYPRTTYSVGEPFSNSGLLVSEVYDNGDTELLDSSQYTIDASQFDSTQAGTYVISIIPVNTELATVSLPVTVREEAEQEWGTIRFGQSTSTTNNKVTVLEDGTIRLEALGGSAGKITGDHDGISFYYTELDAIADNFELSADIKVIEYAKPNHDGQESFGLMARDAIGAAGNSSVFASNIAAVGGFSGSTTNPNGTQLFARTGVASPDGAGSEGIKSIMLRNERPAPGNTVPAQPYRLTLAKTNSGFIGRINDEPEQLLFEPDILSVQNNRLYVGFYAARLATIEVSNVQLKISAADTDEPRRLPPPAAIEPQVQVVSLDKTADTSYKLIVKANVNGSISVKQGQISIADEIAVQKDQETRIPAQLASTGHTNFSIVFLPDDSQYLTSYNKIVTNFTVRVKSFTGDIYVSPEGISSAAGTREQPIDLDTAIAFVQAGQRIIMLDGRYVRSSKLEIAKYNDGKPGKMKYLVADTGAVPILDFDKKSEGVVLSGSYWHIKGLDVTRSAGNTKGFTIGGSYNIVESSRFYENGDTGLQISRTDSTENDRSKWPSHNLILNSTSFDNRDPSDNNADGFAAKLTSGVGNVFRGCIAHNNIDDGWDLYTKAGTGAIGAVLIEDSIAYNNGFLTSGVTGAGDKNGFKLGGEGIHVPHKIVNSIAFGNGAYGFTSNSNPGVIAVNNIAFDNKGGNLSFTTYSGIATDFTIDGFISYQNSSAAKDNYPASLQANNNYLFDGEVSKNKAGTILQDRHFASLIPSLPYQRAADGSIIRGSFLQFIAPGTYPGAGGNSGITLPENKVNGSTIELVAKSDNGRLIASVSEQQLRQAIEGAESQAGTQFVVFQMKAAGDESGYEVTLPGWVLAGQEQSRDIVLASELATLRLPSRLLNNTHWQQSDLLTIAVSADPNKKIWELRLLHNGEPIDSFGLMAPYELHATYMLEGKEIDNPELLAIKHVDENGNTTAVASGRYDPISGEVSFTAVRVGIFKLIFAPKTFADLQQTPWAKRDIEVMASKDIINGMSEEHFAPEAAIKRADFVRLIVRALQLTGAAADAFADVKQTDYYYEDIAIAKQLGIIAGKGNNSFDPRGVITREEMFVIMSRALQAANLLQKKADETLLLDKYTDYSLVADYASAHILALVQMGIVKGDDKRQLKPQALSTRAEAAALIYRLYNIAWQ